MLSDYIPTYLCSMFVQVLLTTASKNPSIATTLHPKEAQNTSVDITLRSNPWLPVIATQSAPSLLPPRYRKRKYPSIVKVYPRHPCPNSRLGPGTFYNFNDLLDSSMEIKRTYTTTLIIPCLKIPQW